MKIAIGIGGSGIRCLEVLLYLLASGLGVDDEYIFMTIDPDSANGNLQRLKQLLGYYQNIYNRGNDLIFKKRITTIDGNIENINCSPIATSSLASLSDKIGFSSLDAGKQKMIKIFYSEKELKIDPTEGGFRAHPSVGTSIFPDIRENPQWENLITKIQNNLNNLVVFIFGSIFGGTGASGFPYIGKLLREQFGEPLKMGGTILLPYFSFDVSEISGINEELLYANSTYFTLNTKIALQFYNTLWNSGEESPYNALYYVGFPSWLKRTAAIRGSSQKNPIHIVELISALSAIDFYNNYNNLTTRQDKPAFYSGATDNKIHWDDLPFSDKDQLKKSLLYFTVFGFSYIDFYMPIIFHPEFEKNQYLYPWYIDYIRSESEAFLSEENRTKLYSLGNFFRNYYFPAIKGILEESSVVELFDINSFSFIEEEEVIYNSDVIPNVVFYNGPREIGKLIKNKEILYAYDKIWNYMEKKDVRSLPHLADRFINLLFDAVKKFVDKYYLNIIYRNLRIMYWRVK